MEASLPRRVSVYPVTTVEIMLKWFLTNASGRCPKIPVKPSKLAL
jgi:hypothetical protein